MPVFNSAKTNLTMAKITFNLKMAVTIRAKQILKSFLDGESISLKDWQLLKEQKVITRIPKFATHANQKKN